MVQVTDRSPNHWHQAMVDPTVDSVAPSIISGMPAAYVDVGSGYAVSPGLTDLHAGAPNSMTGSLWACGWFRLRPKAPGANPEDIILLNLVSSGDTTFAGGICLELAFEQYTDGTMYIRSKRVNGPGGPPHTLQTARSVNVAGLTLGFHYIAVKYDQPSNTWSFYLDGATVTTGTITNPTGITNPADTPRAYICERGPTERWYSAIAWGNGTPTAAAINALYTTRNSGSAAYQTAVLAMSGIQSYWSLDEFPRGTMKDSSGKYQDAWYDTSGVERTTGMPPGAVTSARLSGSYALNGGGQSFVDGSALGGNFTLWGLIDDDGGSAGFVSTLFDLQDDANVTRIQLKWSNDPSLNQFTMTLFRQSGASGTAQTFTMAAIPALADGPHSFGVGYEASTNIVKFYVDGALKYTNDQPGSGAAFVTPVTLIVLLGAAVYHNRMSHFTIYSSLLTDPNHSNLYAQSLVSSAALVSALQALP